ncbi:hypothetical protein K505DRAFT_342475 [Melanomma pulvis-pyrius CBS 109.77]|uniref:Uncharacterized protein n=1 Tax=Melanomma pulvis-pyrius CBS 109.77 TaxID=1314802 RepID=A0A6A6WW76_9PLEO|nr:hypothetical protein K505DRAFT_342475 [Melanomma pulvis-pyrius CBS 109.77]
MANWPFSNAKPPSPPISPYRHEENDGYEDMIDDVTNLPPSARQDMKDTLNAQHHAEHHTIRPRPSMSIRTFKSSPSMDDEILKDAVKQKEVMEKTNHASHDLAARKQRHQRRWDKARITSPLLLDLDKLLNDIRVEEFHAERKYGYDDCYLALDDPEGCVFIDSVEVGGEVENKGQQENSQHGSGAVNGVKSRVLKWVGWGD